MKRTLVILALLSFAAGVAHAWWDTQVRAQTAEPLAAAARASECAGAADMRDDARADGGRGGKVVFLAPGKALTFRADLKRSVYSVWMIARSPAENLNPSGEAERTVVLPGGEAKIRYPRQVVYVSLSVKRPDGSTHDSFMPVPYDGDYGIVSKQQFILHQDGPCEITMSIDARSEAGLLVNRIEVRDTLGHCARVAAKTKRMLTTDEEVARARAEFAASAAKSNRPVRWLPTAALAPEARRARNDQLWESLPPLNLVTADPKYRGWQQAMGQENRMPGGIIGGAAAYEATGNEEIAMDAAVLLCAFAEKYPGLDHYYAETGQYSNLGAADPLRWGSRMGKTVYSGHSGPELIRCAKAYDRLFDFIRNSQVLADYVGTRIPWVKTPRDVIELIDTNLLQHGHDCNIRRVIRSDVAAAVIPLIQGVNDVSRKMLENGLFSKVHYDMADAGGLDDQAFTAFSRGGVHYIGATGYVGPALTEIAETLKKYVAAGGDPRFDLDDPVRYPHMPEAERTKHGLHAAGGFPIIIGDSMDLRRRREANIPAFPSRVIEGFGAVVLEDGQDAANARAKRALGIHTGIGRGHAHQDTLNIEMFAHGCRLAPDLGGRHEGRNRSSPNMRVNRMHNLVEVDERNFENTYPGSTVSATGWTVSFSPQPGAQYTANAARALSHPGVSLYHRATAMIDGDVTATDADVYVFDVFRVEGGSVHTYCFHGAPTDGDRLTAINSELAPAASETAKAYLRGRPEESQFEGAAADPLVATWMLQEKLRQSYQAEAFQADRPVSLTLTLFGRARDLVMVGSASSEVYPVAMPYLHVQRRAEEGLSSVYPAIYEAHAGPRFITDAARLAVQPGGDAARSPVAVKVVIKGTRTDTLFSSADPAVACAVESGMKAAAEFAMISEDAQGLRLLHMVGGTEVSKGDVAVRCPRAAYEAEVAAVAFPRHDFTLSEDMPASLLDGQVALLGNPRHWAEFRLASVAGRAARVEKTPRFYQSPIEAVLPAERAVATELEPLVYGPDALHGDGTTVANEAHDRFWRASLQTRERWMYLGWPGTDLSYPREVRLEDLPDANGDGKRTLRLMAREAERAEKGDVLLELEVTRVDPAHHLFYFRMPENPDYQQGGWQFANRRLVNEDGSKTWLATYPGTTFSWSLEGDGEVGDAAFSDADGDGKRKLYAYHFGPGDRFQVKTFVYVKRVAPGAWEVRANTPCALSLTGRSFNITAAQLAAGKGVVRLTP